MNIGSLCAGFLFLYFLSGSDLIPREGNQLQVMMDQFIKLHISIADYQVIQNLFWLTFSFCLEAISY